MKYELGMDGKKAWDIIKIMGHSDHKHKRPKKYPRFRLKHQSNEAGERIVIVHLDNNSTEHPFEKGDNFSDNKDFFIECGNEYYDAKRGGIDFKSHKSRPTKSKYYIYFFEYLWENYAKPEFQPFNSSIDGVDRSKLSELKNSIRKRVGQSIFRERLICAYDCRCAITGCAVGPVLEAAHIEPYVENENQSINNGLLLRSDIHLLFDQGLIWIDTDYNVHIDASLKDTEYGPFDNKRLYIPERQEDWPSIRHIEWRLLHLHFFA